MDADREERLKRRARWRNATAVAGVVMAVAGHLMRDSALLPYFMPLALIAIAVSIVSLVRDRRLKQRIRDGHEGERWPLGEPYQLQYEYRGTGARRAGELDVGEDDLSILVNFQEAVAIEFADVRRVRVRRTSIDLETEHEVLMLVPSTYDDRRRLLWELAVRCPDAMERGMDEDVAHAKPQGATAPAVPASADEAPRGSSGLSLGSALAGPMDRGNPAPPRKSGLGVGLFVPPPGTPPTDE